MKKPGAILVFANLNVAFFDEHDNQVPELQKSVATMLCEQGELHGYDMEGAAIDTPSGRWRMSKDQDGAWRRVRIS